MSSSYLGSPPNQIFLDRNGTDTVFNIRIKGDPIKAWAAADAENPIAAACARGLMHYLENQSDKPVPAGVEQKLCPGEDFR
jgi:hypothetical protein